jgi:hypothetical protein
MAISVALALLGTGTVLAWRRAAHGRPAPQPAAFATLLLLAGFLAPNVAALALTPAARPLVVPCVLTVVLVLGFAACVRPARDER